CSDLTGNVNAAGSFDLRQVSDQSGTSNVPYSFTDNNGNDIFLQSDTYILETNGSYTETRFQTVNGQSESPGEFGSWTQSGNTVFFEPSQSDFDLTPYQGTVRSSGQFNGSRTLTISINGSTAVYTD
ncbi:MAG: hypothetical protein ACRENK_15170, partial [Gemmatimonadaceae bacterium]